MSKNARLGQGAGQCEEQLKIEEAEKCPPISMNKKMRRRLDDTRRDETRVATAVELVRHLVARWFERSFETGRFETRGFENERI